MAIQQINLGTAPTGVGGDTNRSAYTKINQNFTDSANSASRQVGIATGNVMEVGAFGLGATAPKTTSITNLAKGQFFAYLSKESDDTSNVPEFQMGLHLPWVDNSNSVQILFGLSGTGQFGIRWWDAYGKKFSPYLKVYHTGNTTVDGNGFIKNASPIVKLFADKIELNDEAKLQPIAFEKLGVGDYLIKGSLGFAQEGWYIEMPKDANGNVLVAVVYEQLANNDISVKTYDYMLNKKGRIVPDLETPLDIPETRWIDLRLQALPQEVIQPLSADETVNTNAE